MLSSILDDQQPDTSAAPDFGTSGNKQWGEALGDMGGAPIIPLTAQKPAPVSIPTAPDSTPENMREQVVSAQQFAKDAVAQNPNFDRNVFQNLKESWSRSTAESHFNNLMADAVESGDRDVQNHVQQLKSIYDKEKAKSPVEADNFTEKVLYSLASSAPMVKLIAVQAGISLAKRTALLAASGVAETPVVGEIAELGAAGKSVYDAYQAVRRTSDAAKLFYAAGKAYDVAKYASVARPIALAATGAEWWANQAVFGKDIQGQIASQMLHQNPGIDQDILERSSWWAGALGAGVFNVGLPNAVDAAVKAKFLKAMELGAMKGVTETYKKYGISPVAGALLQIPKMAATMGASEGVAQYTAGLGNKEQFNKDLERGIVTGTYEEMHNTKYASLTGWEAIQKSFDAAIQSLPAAVGFSFPHMLGAYAGNTKAKADYRAEQALVRDKKINEEGAASIVDHNELNKKMNDAEQAVRENNSVGLSQLSRMNPKELAQLRDKINKEYQDQSGTTGLLIPKSKDAVLDWFGTDRETSKKQRESDAIVQANRAHDEMSNHISDSLDAINGKIDWRKDTDFKTRLKYELVEIAKKYGVKAKEAALDKFTETKDYERIDKADRKNLGVEYAPPKSKSTEEYAAYVDRISGEYNERMKAAGKPVENGPFGKTDIQRMAKILSSGKDVIELKQKIRAKREEVAKRPRVAKPTKEEIANQPYRNGKASDDKLLPYLNETHPDLAVKLLKGELTNQEYKDAEKEQRDTKRAKDRAEFVAKKQAEKAAKAGTTAQPKKTGAKSEGVHVVGEDGKKTIVKPDGKNTVFYKNQEWLVTDELSPNGTATKMRRVLGRNVDGSLELGNSWWYPKNSELELKTGSKAINEHVGTINKVSLDKEDRKTDADAAVKEDKTGGDEGEPAEDKRAYDINDDNDVEDPQETDQEDIKNWNAEAVDSGDADKIAQLSNDLEDQGVPEREVSKVLDYAIGRGLSPADIAQMFSSLSEYRLLEDRMKKEGMKYVWETEAERLKKLDDGGLMGSHAARLVKLLRAGLTATGKNAEALGIEFSNNDFKRIQDAITTLKEKYNLTKKQIDTLLRSVDSLYSLRAFIDDPERIATQEQVKVGESVFQRRVDGKPQEYIVTGIREASAEEKKMHFGDIATLKNKETGKVISEPIDKVSYGDDYTRGEAGGAPAGNVEPIVPAPKAPVAKAEAAPKSAKEQLASAVDEVVNAINGANSRTELEKVIRSTGSVFKLAKEDSALNDKLVKASQDAARRIMVGGGKSGVEKQNMESPESKNGYDHKTESDHQITINSYKFKQQFGDWEKIPLAERNVDPRFNPETGEPQLWEHYTSADGIKKFDLSKIGQTSGDSGYRGAGFYFARYGTGAKLYGPNRLLFYLNTKNPIHKDSKTTFSEIMPRGLDEGTAAYGFAVRMAARENGVDGVFIGDEATVYNSEDIIPVDKTVDATEKGVVTPARVYAGTIKDSLDGIIKNSKSYMNSRLAEILKNLVGDNKVFLTNDKDGPAGSYYMKTGDIEHNVAHFETPGVNKDAVLLHEAIHSL